MLRCHLLMTNLWISMRVFAPIALDVELEFELRLVCWDIAHTYHASTRNSPYWACQLASWLSWYKLSLHLLLAAKLATLLTCLLDEHSFRFQFQFSLKRWLHAVWRSVHWTFNTCWVVIIWWLLMHMLDLFQGVMGIKHCRGVGVHDYVLYSKKGSIIHICYSIINYLLCEKPFQVSQYCKLTQTASL